jgi:hypothetical protein
LLSLGIGTAIALSRRRRSIDTDPPEVLEFIRGLLSRPQILHDLPVLATRPLIRTLGGRRISIARCRALATSGRLFIAATESSRAVTGSRMRGDILDAGHATSRLVATMMDAQDLEWWARAMRDGRRSPLLHKVEALLTTIAPCEVVAVSGVHGVLVVDRSALQTSSSPKLSVALDVEHPGHQRALSLYDRHPSLAATILVEAVAPSLPSDPRAVRKLTTASSRGALRELLEEATS